MVLRHNLTNKTLNSGDVVGPVTHTSQEVSCYGHDDQKNVVRDDLWRIEVRLCGMAEMKMASIFNLSLSFFSLPVRSISSN